MPANVKRIGRATTKHGKFEFAFEVCCIKCNRIRIVKRRQHAIGMSCKPCKKCSNKNNHPAGEQFGIRLSFFRKYKVNAEMRSKPWNITIEDAGNTLINQNNKCALSGIPLISSGDFKDITASLDRIDNSIGYEKDNIQWVHKEINMMRGTLTIERFIEICKSVAIHNEKATHTCI